MKMVTRANSGMNPFRLSQLKNIDAWKKVGYPQPDLDEYLDSMRKSDTDPAPSPTCACREPRASRTPPRSPPSRWSSGQKKRAGRPRRPGGPVEQAQRPQGQGQAARGVQGLAQHQGHRRLRGLSWPAVQTPRSRVASRDTAAAAATRRSDARTAGGGPARAPDRLGVRASQRWSSCWCSNIFPLVLLADPQLHPVDTSTGLTIGEVTLDNWRAPRLRRPVLELGLVHRHLHGRPRSSWSTSSASRLR